MRMILLGLMLLATCCLAGCGSDKVSTPSTPPLPSGTPTPPVIGPSRRGLYFGYFGGAQDVDDISGHSNMLFEPCWGGIDVGIANMKKAKLPTILVVSDALFGLDRLYLGSDIAKQYLREGFAKLRAEGVLSWVMGIYPIDEPDISPQLSEESLRTCITDVKAVMAEFVEIASAKLVVTYGGGENYKALDMFDWIGFDDYGPGAGIFAPGGKYDRLKSRLRPDQRLTLFPGGADPWRCDPLPFYTKAQEDFQVLCIIPFIWHDQWANTSNLGIKSNGLAPYYIAVGDAIKKEV